MVNTVKVEAAPTVALIHDAGLFAEGLACMLEKTPFRIALWATSLEVASLDWLQAQAKLIVLVGGSTASQIVEAVRRLRSSLVSAYILVIGAASEAQEVRLALEAGADGYLRESTTSETLMMAIQLTLRDETILPAAFAKTLANNSTVKAPAMPSAEISYFRKKAIMPSGHTESANIVLRPSLSAREELILQNLIKGATNKSIAQRLSIAEATVKVHVKAILRKIRAKNRTQAAIWAIKYYTSKEVNTRITT